MFVLSCQKDKENSILLDLFLHLIIQGVLKSSMTLSPQPSILTSNYAEHPMLYKGLNFTEPSPNYDPDLCLELLNFMFTSAVKMPSQFFGFEKSRSHFQDASKLSY